MAITKIKYRQLDLESKIKNSDVANDAAIETGKLAQGAEFLQRDGSVAYTGDQDAGGNKIANVAAPTLGADAANKNYVDSRLQGLSSKESVRAATSSNITLSGTQTIDGVALTSGDRVLVKGQTDASENGIYVASASAWSRSADADSDSEVTPNLFVFVEEGFYSADTGWTLSNDAGIVVGTTSLAFVQFSSAGIILADESTLTKSGNELSVKDLGVTNEKIADATITNAKISESAAIAPSKIATDSSNRFVTDAEKAVYTGKQDFIVAGSVGTYYAGDKTFKTLDTDAVAEGSNLYFTDARAKDAAVAIYVAREVATGVMNEVNLDFVIANTPRVGTEMVFVNGILQNPGGSNDYTISGATITLAEAPISGDVVLVTYFK
jgi:hypothetical protein